MSLGNNKSIPPQPPPPPPRMVANVIAREPQKLNFKASILRKNLTTQEKIAKLKVLSNKKNNNEINDETYNSEKNKILTDYSFQLHKEDINESFLVKTLKTDIEFSQSEQNLSAILAGFSLGSVVALLFIERNIIVSIMFACSIIASWLFIFTTLHKTFMLESLRTSLKYFNFYFEIEDQYNLIRKAHFNSRYWDVLFFIAFLNFIIVLISASFLVHYVFGILGTCLCGALLILIYKNMRLLKFEKYYFEWKNIEEYDENLPLTAHNRH